MEQRRLSGVALGAIGLLLAGIQAAHAARQTDIPVAMAVDAVPFVAMGLGLAFAGYWLTRETDFDGRASRIVLWSVGGMVALTAVAALVLFGQRVTTGSLSRAAYLTMDLVTVGALAGALVGLYDARSRHRLDELAIERDRIERFAGKAADVNNYGRAIYGAGSVDGVAAYVIEAAEALVGLRETALVRVDDEGVTVVASTIRIVDENALADLAAAATDQPARDVVVHGREVPVDLPPEAESVVTALVDEREAGATVIVSVSTDAAVVADQDRQLLELVVSHAAATIGRLAHAGERTPAGEAGE